MAALRPLALTLALAGLVGCSATAQQPEPTTPAAIELALGGAFPTWSAKTLAGADLVVPDPSGGIVILEMIRSADW